VVEKTPNPPSDAAAATVQPSPASPELDGERSVSSGGNFVSSAGGVAMPAQSQPKAEAIGRPMDPRP
jgi:hypothetical protein